MAKSMTFKFSRQVRAILRDIITDDPRAKKLTKEDLRKKTKELRDLLAEEIRRTSSKPTKRDGPHSDLGRPTRPGPH